MPVGAQVGRMEAQPMNSEFSKSRYPHRKLFYGGIGFWIFAWIAAICIYQEVDLNVRGYHGVAIGVGVGSIVIQVDETIATSTEFRARDPVFLWSKGVWEQIWEGPGIWGYPANGGWRHRAGTTSVYFPIAGFLWLWLVGGWAAEIRYRRLAQVQVDGESVVTPYSRRRLIVLTVALTALGSTVTYLAICGHRIRDTNECYLNVRNIQQAVRGWSGMNSVNIGGPVVWSDIIGAGKFLPTECGKCPSGGDYQLSPVNPANGELAARCPHPEHRRFIESKDTTDW